MEIRTYNELTENEQLETLANIIEQNPDAIFRIDNDCWSMYENYVSDDDQYDPIEYANDDQFNKLENCYGIALSRAMIVVLNRRGFNLDWEPV